MWGRESELKELMALLDKKSASMVVMSGRRRIGKSTLAQAFGKKHFKHYFEFAGLAPHPKQTNQDQLDNFANQLKEQTSAQGLHFQEWGEAFAMLNSLANKNFSPTFILLDEISWMGGLDLDFPGKLKIAWDSKFKANSKLILVICGSVTSWIQENILMRSDFVGRISLELFLQELPLSVLSNFWGKRQVNASEKLTMLCVTGGVPRYLEEIRPSTPADQEIARLCFRRTGFFFNEFDKIFNEIYQKKAASYLAIVRCLVSQQLSGAEIAKKLKKDQNNDLTAALNALQLGGFLSRDFSYMPDGKKSKISFYRIKDNYLRFYLKYIEPQKDKILQTGIQISSIDELPQWNAMVGYQFETLILNHIDEVLNKLNIAHSSVLSASPYFQRKKTRNKGGCQIDLLISCRHNTLYVCEIKFRRSIDKSVIADVKSKISVMENSKHYSIRPVLLYAGLLNPNDEADLKEYFDKIVSIEDLLG